VEYFVSEPMDKSKKHIDFEQKLEKFWQKGFDEQEKANFEQFLSENPFEQEAFEGLQSLDKATFKADIAELTQKLPQYQRKNVSWRAIAASVAILLGILGIIVWLSQEVSIETPIALEKSEPNVNQHQQEPKLTPQTTEAQKNIEERQNSTQRMEIQTIRPPKETSSAQRNYIDGTEAQPLQKIQETPPEIKQDDASIIESRKETEKNVTPKQETREVEEIQSAFAEKDDKKVKQEQIEKKQRATNRPQKFKADKESRAFNTEQAAGLNASEIWQAQVLDAVTGKPLQGVVVFLEKSPHTQLTTDKEGNFSLQVPLNEKNILHLQKKGYKSLQVEIQDLLTKTFYLQPEK
jgi:hypothetical protein